MKALHLVCEDVCHLSRVACRVWKHCFSSSEPEVARFTFNLSDMAHDVLYNCPLVGSALLVTQSSTAFYVMKENVNIISSSYNTSLHVHDCSGQYI